MLYDTLTNGFSCTAGTAEDETLMYCLGSGCKTLVPYSLHLDLSLPKNGVLYLLSFFSLLSPTHSRRKDTRQLGDGPFLFFSFQFQIHSLTHCLTFITDSKKPAAWLNVGSRSTQAKNKNKLPAELRYYETIRNITLLTRLSIQSAARSRYRPYC